MTAKSRAKLAEAFKGAIVSNAITPSDEADRLGPPQAVFRSPYLRGIRFECRAMERQPKEETVAFLYRRDGDNLRQSGVVLFRDGQWLKEGRRPLDNTDGMLWAALVDDR